MTHLVVDNTSAVPRATRLPMRMRQAEVVVDVDLDRRELRRREQCGSPPILNLDLLNLLLEMPVSSPVTRGDLSDYGWRLLRAGERLYAVDLIQVDGLVRVVRRAVPPLAVRHVRVSACHWRAGFSVASRFAPYGSRELVLDQLPASDIELRLEATYLGIGIAVRSEDADVPARRLVEPAPFAPARYTGASWLFAERLLAQQPRPKRWAVLPESDPGLHHRR